MIPPSAAPMMSSGARMPPLVPEPRPVDQMTSLTSSRAISPPTAILPLSSAAMTVYPTPSVLGSIRPPAPMTRPPIAGHHAQWIGSFLNRSSAP